MGKVKRLELWWQLYRTSLPVWDLEDFRPMDFCWHECAGGESGAIRRGELSHRQAVIHCMRNNAINLHRNMSWTSERSVMANDLLQHASEYSPRERTHWTTYQNLPINEFSDLNKIYVHSKWNPKSNKCGDHSNKCGVLIIRSVEITIWSTKRRDHVKYQVWTSQAAAGVEITWGSKYGDHSSKCGDHMKQ